MVGQPICKETQGARPSTIPRQTVVKDRQAGINHTISRIRQYR